MATRRVVLCGMKPKLRELLARAERNAMEGQRRIEAQRELLAGLDPDSADAAIAREILRSHLGTQIILQNHLRQLRSVLEADLKTDHNGGAHDS